MDTQVALDQPVNGAARQEVRRAFAGWLARAVDPILILGHHDTDGLAAAAILERAIQQSGRKASVRIFGRGENPWTEGATAALNCDSFGSLIVADLGARPTPIAPGRPTLIIDHHVAQDAPTDAYLISGYGLSPVPCSALLAYWCAGAIIDPEPLLWLAAMGMVGDMAEDFSEFDAAKARYGVTALRKAAALINAARRAPSGDARAALALLLKAGRPQDVLSGVYPETAELLAARNEVNAALEAARRLPPRIRNGVALIQLDTPCQIHPLIAQQWRSRLKSEIVMAANRGYRAGWVHFAVRSARDIDLIDFLARRRPPGADENYGSGHHAATGGALPIPIWNAFIASLGFGPEEQIHE